MTWPDWAAVLSLYVLQNSTMLMPCGPSAVPTGGAGVALPAGSCRVRTVRIFFAIWFLFYLRLALELLDLEEVQFDGSLAAEDADQHLDLVALGVDFVDRTDELGERTVGDAYALALLEGDAVLGRFDTHLAQDLLDLVLFERHGLVARAGNVAATDEAGHTRRVAHDEPRFRVEDHLDQHVAGIDLLLDRHALAAADLYLVLFRHEDLEDLVLHAHRLDAVLEVGLDLLLVARVRVNHVPALLGRLLGQVVEEAGHAGKNWPVVMKRSSAV